MNHRRLIPRLLLCLTLGALTTIVIAWSCCLRSEDTKERMSEVRFFVPKRSAVTIASALGYTRIVVSQPPHGVRADIPVLPTLHDLPLPFGVDDQALIATYPFINLEVAGFPFRCLRLRSTAGRSSAPPPYEDGIRLFPNRLPPGLYSTEGRVPVHPLPLGLTLDVAFFAGLWCIALLAPRLIRSHLRLHRNLCPHCAYPRTGLPQDSACPECGRTL